MPIDLISKGFRVRVGTEAILLGTPSSSRNDTFTVGPVILLIRLVLDFVVVLLA